MANDNQAKNSRFLFHIPLAIQKFKKKNKQTKQNKTKHERECQKEGKRWQVFKNPAFTLGTGLGNEEIHFYKKSK